MDAATAKNPAQTDVSTRDMANAIRALSMDAVEKAASGHPGMPMGMADVATVLFTRFLKFDPRHPNWPDRDRFILSAGHGSMLLYSLLHLTGYADMTLDELKRFRQLGSKTAGHPEYGHAQGIETTTGPLGQGLANSVGFALAERILNARFGNDLVDHHTYVIAGDGCLMEGISQEAISLAGHLKLSKLIVLWDNNSISIDGPTSLSTSENQIARFQAANWATLEVDGHDADAVAAALKKAQTHDKPTLIACKTVIGYGAPTKAGTAATHGSPLGKDEIAGARQKLGWSHEPFVVPDAIRAAWAKAGQRGQADYAAWAKRHDTSANRAEHDRVMAHELPANFAATVNTLKESIAAQAPKIATRQSSQNVLEALVPVMPELIGGSADLTGSNNTKTKTATPIKAGAYGGNYIYYGIREHEMAAAMNGLALHGGIIPFGGTFLVFTDYCRPAIRLSALMHQRVIYVMTHDSIGLGEDGPTHQPVEHLAALRAIPNLLVFRPADTMETAECWALALSTKNRPSILALTRQALPHLRADAASANHCARGGYIIRPAKAARKVTLIATGSEVSLAVEAREALEAQGIGTAVVSLPCWELFDEQPESYRKEVLGDGLRVGIEAAGDFGWSRYLGSAGIFVGMPGFGASAPAPDLYKHFGITAAAIVEKVKAKI
jgi:transketolase